MWAFVSAEFVISPNLLRFYKININLVAKNQ